MSYKITEVKEIISPAQCRAGRALLDWSQTDLANAAEVGVSTIADFERGQRVPTRNNRKAVRKALEDAGVSIIGQIGVSLKQG